MWGKGKKRDSEGSAVGDGDGRPSKKAAGDRDSDDILVCELSKNRRLSVRKWQGKLQVDIREFYEKDEKLLPGKKGISLPMDQWKTLHDHVDAIDKALHDNA